MQQLSSKAVLTILCILVSACASQRVDTSFAPRVVQPAFTGRHPSLCIDEGHYNSHTATGLYKPFARLAEADGFRVVRNRARFESGVPAACEVLVIVNAAGGKTYKMFGLNLPTKGHAQRDRSAFSALEADSVRSWIARGGSLLLIADHYPYGTAAALLAKSLDVDMSGGFAQANNRASDKGDPSQLVYTSENHLLGEHPIIRGRNPGETVHRVMTFTGQSLASHDGVPLLLLGEGATDFVPPPPNFVARPAAGRAQGIALERGRGRVVVLGEAGMLSAQLDQEKGRPFGMQVSGIDNQQFGLNILRWLARAL